MSRNELPVGTRHGVSLHTTNYNNVGSCHGMTLQRNGTNQFSKPIKNSISVIITDAFDFNVNSAAKWHNLNNRGC